MHADHHVTTWNTYFLHNLGSVWHRVSTEKVWMNATNLSFPCSEVRVALIPTSRGCLEDKVRKVDTPPPSWSNKASGSSGTLQLLLRLSAEPPMLCPAPACTGSAPPWLSSFLLYVPFYAYRKVIRINSLTFCLFPEGLHFATLALSSSFSLYRCMSVFRYYFLS